jgi:hypothetical protein
VKQIYNNLPNFTAEKSLFKNSIHMRNECTFILRYDLMKDVKVITAAQRHIDPHTWCDEDDPCDPVTKTKTICRWREDLKDCVCSSRQCIPPCSCYNNGRPVGKTEGDCLDSGYSWCCYDPKTGIESCTIE